MQMLYRLSYVGTRAMVTNDLTKRMERETGFEPATLSLEG
jgi:hypothetical protein